MNTLRAKLGLLLLLLAVIAVYSNHFENGFHFDDSHAVENNIYIRDLRNLPRYFTDGTMISVLPQNQGYRPLLPATLAIDYAMGGGLVPFYFHLSTFVVFLALIIAIYLMYCSILARVEHRRTLIAMPALFMTAWFSLHTVCPETINYICQRTEVYSLLGVVTGLLLFIRYPRQRRRGVYLIPVLIGALAKPLAIMFGPILFFYHLLFEERSTLCFWKRAFSWRAFGRSLAVSTPALMTGVGLYGLQSWMTPNTADPGGVSLTRYVFTQPWVYGHYLRSLFLPTQLTADTDMGVLEVSDPRAYIGFLLLFAIAGTICIASGRKAMRPVSFGLIWFLVALVPTTFIPLAEVMNDHRMFFPFVGLILAVVWPVALVLDRALAGAREHRLLEPALWIAAVVFLAPYAYGAYVRNEVWRTEETLWRDASEKSPKNGRALMNYGLTLMARGDYRAALDYFERARLLTPHYHTLEVNLGIARAGLGEKERAEHHFKLAQEFDRNAASSYYYYAQWLLHEGRTFESMKNLETGLKKVPANFDLRHLLMKVYLARGDWFHAHELAEESLKLAPLDVDSADAKRESEVNAGEAVERAQQEVDASPTEDRYLALSFALYYAGRFPESIQAAREILVLNPLSAEAHNNIASAYAAMRRWDDAIAEASAALRLRPGYTLARNNLHWAKAEKMNEQAR